LSEEYGVPPSIVEASGGSADLAKQLCAALHPHSRVLYPCSASAMPHLTERLTHAGHEVRKLVCYTTVPIPLGERLTLEWSSINAVVVAAPSAVIALAEEPGLVPGLPFIAIGAATAAALLDRGMRVAAISPRPEIGGLARAVKSAC
jgi:uroporphyrinogen-III synthase